MYRHLTQLCFAALHVLALPDDVCSLLVCNCRMPNIGELSLYDVVGTAGVAADVSHMDSKPKVMADKMFPLQVTRA